MKEFIQRILCKLHLDWRQDDNWDECIHKSGFLYYKCKHCGRIVG